MASGLSSAVGFKNGTDGGLTVALNALKSVASPHRFLGISQEGKVACVITKGNPYAHIVLRGGDGQTNYDAQSIAHAEQRLKEQGVSTRIMVDCSHANSTKKPEKQPEVAANVADQIKNGNQSICSLMIESNIAWGNQAIPQDKSQLVYGVSVTDACIDWATTKTLMLDLCQQLKEVLPQR